MLALTLLCLAWHGIKPVNRLLAEFDVQGTEYPMVE